MASRILFRADGNEQMGLGHIYRSLAVAEAISPDLECWFISHKVPIFIENQIKNTCHHFVQLSDDIKGAKEAKWIADELLNPRDVVILDGYHFGTGYQLILKSAKISVVSFDDVQTTHYASDLVINHAGGLRPTAFSAEPYTKFYLGPKYALLRKPFLEASKHDRPLEENNNILVSLGGADPQNDTLTVLKQLEQYTEDAQVNLIIGPSYSHKSTLDAFIETTSLNIRILSNLNSKEMVEVMKKNPIAICPPSTISYEYLSVGGILYLFQIADNQRRIKSYLLNEGLAFDFKDFPIKNHQSLKKSMHRQRSVFDGESHGRLRTILNFQSQCYRSA